MLGELLTRTWRLLASRRRKSSPTLETARTLAEAGDHDAAAAALERALEANPQDAGIWAILADLRFELALVDEALDAYRTALALNPGLQRTRSNMLFALGHRIDDPAALLKAHREWGRRVAVGKKAQTFPNEPDPHRRLRIGYVSADLRAHAVSMFIEPLLAHHDPRQVEIYCYDNAPSPDAVATRLRSYPAVWRDIRALDASALRRQVLADRIDLIVDLSGHTAGNRLTDVAQRLAPVQATYLGYHGTTGLQAMDYRISDPHVDPVGLSEDYYVESLARLPNCLWCYRPPHAGAPPPVRGAGIGITLASLNNLRKIAPPMLSIWARVLRALPQARLVIAGAGDSRAARGMRARLVKEGVDASRVELVGWLQPGAFAELHGRIDIALDTYPFNGGATTISALHNGVPVVSMAGRCAASRCGLTILANAAIPELAARDGDEFVDVARALANDPARLRSLKRELPGIMQRSPLMNEVQFVADFEQLCRGLWHRWCRSAPPA